MEAVRFKQLHTNHEVLLLESRPPIALFGVGEGLVCEVPGAMQGDETLRRSPLVQIQSCTRGPKEVMLLKMRVSVSR